MSEIDKVILPLRAFQNVGYHSTINAPSTENNDICSNMKYEFHIILKRHSYRALQIE